MQPTQYYIVDNVIVIIRNHFLNPNTKKYFFSTIQLINVYRM